MSDSSYASVAQFRNCYEIVDDAWLADCLSDDEVEIARSIDVFPDEGPLHFCVLTFMSSMMIDIFATTDRGLTILLSPRSLRTLATFFKEQRPPNFAFHFF